MTADPIRAALSAYCDHAPQHAETVGQKAIIAAVRAVLREIASDGWLSPRGHAEAALLIGRRKVGLVKHEAEVLLRQGMKP